MFKKLICIVFIAFFSIYAPSCVMGADDMYEPNNAIGEAKDLPSSGVFNLQGNDEDWFKLNLKEGQLTLTMTPATSVDLNMYLYNDQRQIVAADLEQGPEHVVYEVVFPGTYYLLVTPTSPKTTAYQLEIGFKGDYHWKTELTQFGPIRHVSVALFDIDSDGQDEVFVATSKRLDEEQNETAPAALVCLETDGTIKWYREFPAISGPDPITGKIYKTTSVSTMPTFANLDSDSDMEILVGVGGDPNGGVEGMVGQPGDRGGVYALDTDGSILWFHKSEDIVGGLTNTGEGRPDGVFSTPVVFDVDGDGNREVIYGGWDQKLWILNATDGTVKHKVHLYDTIWSTPCIADIDNNGLFEILINADITQNADAQVETGGIFHVVSGDGFQNVPGFDAFVGNPAYPNLKGKYEEQALWSSPQTKDLDKDGTVEIIYGTGNYFHDQRGAYVRVWNHDGTERFRLATVGRTFATPLVADIDGDGWLDIVETTLEGYVYAWDHNGNIKFATQTVPYGGGVQPIFSSPIAVDVDSDGRLELFFVQGAQVIEVDSNGNQLNTGKREYIVQFFTGSPAIKDIDGDGQLNLISGGTSLTREYGVVFNWDIGAKNNEGGRVGRNQLFGYNGDVTAFVERFYQTILNRHAEPKGLHDWVERLTSGVFAGSDVARGFIFSPEFLNRNTSDSEYVTILYHAFFNREPDESGYSDWMSKLQDGFTRDQVLDGFLYSLEFGNLCRAYGIRPVR